MLLLGVQSDCWHSCLTQQQLANFHITERLKLLICRAETHMVRDFVSVMQGVTSIAAATEASYSSQLAYNGVWWHDAAST